MKCAIMQPTYLPWSGYFNLMSQVDVFIFLDDVQYERASWQNRNRVLINGDIHWITVPAKRDQLSQVLQTIEIDDHQPWRKKHLKLLEQTYGKHPHGKDMLESVRAIDDRSLTRLVDLNIHLIKFFAQKLGLQNRFERSSDLHITGDRSDRLVKMCQHVQCDEYLSPAGAADYLSEDKGFEGSPVRLSFQKFEPVSYPQKNSPTFVSHMSIVDTLAHLGWAASREYVLGTYAATSSLADTERRPR